MKEEEEDLPNYEQDPSELNDIWSTTDVGFVQNLGYLQNLGFLQDVTDVDIFQLAHSMCTQITPPPPPPQQHQLNRNIYPEIPMELGVGNDTCDFAGYYGFTVGFPSQDDRSSKSSSWIFSEELDELYVRMNKDCPVQINVKCQVPAPAFVRLTPVFRNVRDQNDFPMRCINHSGQDHQSNRDHHAVQHIVRSYLKGADHALEPQTGRASLLLPFINHEITVPNTYIVRFMCHTSCVGGMNRRPFNLLFTLEHNGKCLGRQTKKAHVCAAPRRDIKNELHRLAQEGKVGNTTTGPDSEGRLLLPGPRPSLKASKESWQQLAPLAQDVKRACQRQSSSGKIKAGKKPTKKYTIKVSSLKLYQILSAMQPVVEANLRKQESEFSTEDDS